jgi:Uncharacterized flagellar protein FlaG
MEVFMNIDTVSMTMAARLRRGMQPVFKNARNFAELEAGYAETEIEQRTTAAEKASQAAERIQILGDIFDRKVQFQVNEDLHRVIIKVIDVNTEKVIREIPSEDIQRLQVRIREMTGLLFDAAI